MKLSTARGTHPELSKSFFVTGARSAGDLAHALEESRVSSISGGIVFVSGELVGSLREVAALVGRKWGGPALVVPAAGSISERGEIEPHAPEPRGAAGAATGITWSGGRTEPFRVGRDGLGEAIARASGKRRCTALVFARPDVFDPAELASVRLAAPHATVIGAGTAGASPFVVADGVVSEAPVAGLCLLGGAVPVVEAAPACRLLGDLAPIEEVTPRGMVLTVGGRPALDALRAAAADAVARDTQPLVLAALATNDDAAGDASGGAARPSFVLRALRGVDVERRGVLIGAEARPGRRLGFAVRDADASRAALDEAVRGLCSRASGSVPSFALLLSCAGRGQSLYGAPDVDVKIVRQRLGDVPIAGMHSSFEIAPMARGGAELMMYTAVVALFRSPS